MINIDDQCLMCRRTIEQITNDGDDFEGAIDEGIMCNRCRFIQEHESYKKSIQRCFGIQRLKDENERLEEENKQLKTQLNEKDREIELIKNVKAKEVADILSNIANALSNIIREKLDTATALDLIRAAHEDKTQSMISELEDILRFVNRQIMITTTDATELDMAEAKGCNDVIHDVADKITGRIQVLKGDEK